MLVPVTRIQFLILNLKKSLHFKKVQAFLYPHRDSNANLGFRKPSFYPLNYRGKVVAHEPIARLMRHKDNEFILR